jgi:glycosyltransferase involved in cell wall biosynthesis
MIVDSHNPEFGYELLSSLPYAYYLHTIGKLEGTVSGAGTAPLYYFSPNHKENNIKRHFMNTYKAEKAGVPNCRIHQPELNTAELRFPPYKEIYANEEYKWKKTTVCICNRYNKEWSTNPINYFDLKILDWLFTKLKKDYTIVYFQVDLPEELQDNAHSMKLGDVEFIKNKHPEVKIFRDLIKSSWNETMLKVFANCKHFITMNGGYSIMASYFKGTNIIFSKPGKPQTQELDNKSFWRWYPKIANNRTLHVPSYEELKKKVQSIFVEKQPTINIIIRTSGRPNYFKDCIKSIYNQDYQNYNILVTCDDYNSIKYTRGHNCRVVDVRPIKDTYTRVTKDRPEANSDYGYDFPYNRYINFAQNLINDGYVIILDDDNRFIENFALSKISSKLAKDKLVVWKCKMWDKTLPATNEIKLYNIDSACFAYHISMAKYSDWTQWKRADYRTARNISNHTDVVWMDEELTGMQSLRPGHGTRRDGVKTSTIYCEHLQLGKKKIENVISTDIDGIVEYYNRMGYTTIVK